ncbi:hypothetical protein ASG25_07185 [Rhizobium sp. Leaf384]|uniref:DUF2291 family protein n=1 Tax=unclassified Rhizobium TaxID=2613769 RepID=UPI000715171C|nr:MULTISPECIES: DUF2291 domain-containing protein [unclassified Rhizobium]KQS81258.1 hypothetical protein ASG25_07185 [Rhizobium sp. Leaf384]KQS87166.1 hypothetical protein ASG58_02745 [Rhizobium sp. Leaf383]
MSTLAEPKSLTSPRLTRGRAIATALAVILVGAMAYNTRVVRIGSEHDVRADVFSPEAFGAENFPKVRDSVVSRAVDAAELGRAIAADKAAAGTKYGVATSTGPVIPVKLTGVVGERKSSTNTIAVPGLPEGTVVRVQTGPAINGTDLRDATGDIEFGQFTNQIEYQNAGSALNNAMKKEALGNIDPAALEGKTVDITGVFKLINPKNWLITPVAVTVK